MTGRRHSEDGQRLLLSLSVRIAEDFKVKDRALMPFEKLAEIAARAGYGALCMRASQAGVHTPSDRRIEMRKVLDGLGLKITMVTGDVSLAANDARAASALQHIGPYLDLAEAFGAPLVRVMMQSAQDVPWARDAAAAAAERGLTLAHQMHVGTLFETIDEALDVAHGIGRRGFGITYEPANMMTCGQDWGPDGIARLAPFLVNVYLQNQRLDPTGPITLRLRESEVRVESLPLDAPGGVDLDVVFEGLRRIGYNGPVTVHQSAIPGLPIEAAAQRYFTLLSAYVKGRSGGA